MKTVKHSCMHKHVASFTPKDISVALAKTEKIKRSNAVLATVENTHIKAIPGGLVLTTTNLNVSCITTCKATIIDPKLEMLLPDSAVKTILKLHDDLVLELWYDGKSEMKIRTDNGSYQFTYNTDSTENFPKIPTIEDKKISMKIDGDVYKDLQRIFKLTLKYTSEDSLRPAMTGICFTNEQIAGTDTHRLIVVDFGISSDEFKMIVPKELAELAEIIETKKQVSMNSDGVNLSFNDATTKIIGRLIDADYPKYKVVIPDSYASRVDVPTKEFTEQVKLSIGIANRTTNQIVFDFQQDKYSVTGEDVDFGRELVLHGQCKTHGSNVKIALNGKFLSTIMEMVDGETTSIEMNSDNKPIVIREANYLFLLMPLLIKD